MEDALLLESRPTRRFWCFSTPLGMKALMAVTGAVMFSFLLAQLSSCGACVAACPNAPASLFTSAKIAHLALLPQRQPERYKRSLSMVVANAGGSLRPLHQCGRMRSGLSEGHQVGSYCADESRFQVGRLGRPSHRKSQRSCRLIERCRNASTAT